MKTVLITGGSSGIGFEMSKHFAKAGYKICWIALLDEELAAAKLQLQKEFSQVAIETLALDLSQPDAAQKVYDWIHLNQWTVDVLINNAAFGTFGFANDLPLDKEVAMIELNVLALFKLTRLFLNDMINRDDGSIINISSNASFQPVPKLAAYAASKAFVKHYSQSISEELNALKSNAKVITVCPGPISNTSFKDTAKMQQLQTFDGLLTTTKEEVAKDIWQGFQRGKSFIVTGAKLRRMRYLQAILPKPIVRFLLWQELSDRK